MLRVLPYCPGALLWFPGFELNDEGPFRHCRIWIARGEAAYAGLSRLEVHNRDSAFARQSAAEYDIPRWFTSTAELCASPEVDAVLVTTPNSAHLSDVLIALRHRKPVLVEKPMGMNAEECRRMMTAAEGVGVLLGVAQVFRFT